jgi:hypothetical protein
MKVGNGLEYQLLLARLADEVTEFVEWSLRVACKEHLQCVMQLEITVGKQLSFNSNNNNNGAN